MISLLLPLLLTLLPIRETGVGPGTEAFGAEIQLEQQLVERKFGAMGTEIDMSAIGLDRELLGRALAAAEKELRRVEDMMTSWRDSPLTRLNARAGEGPIDVPPELALVIARGLEIAELTGGAFDPTFAGVGKLWDFKQEPPVLPSPVEVRAALTSVDWRKIHVDLEESRVTIPAGMRVGLGGIAKGYGVDRAMTVLMEHGVKHGLVNAGGDLKALGLKDGHPWRISVRHPRDLDTIMAMVPVSNTCMVTSGDYERFFEHEGKRYHHILDPRTGYPATGCMSVTVVAPDAMTADALATALAVIGPKQGLGLVESLPRVEAILVGLDGEVVYSSGLAGEGD